jgi:polyphosphate glucokinase
MAPRTVLGIDVGGSGIKGAPVDVDSGQLVADRLRIPTPQPSTPKAVAATIVELVAHFAWTGPIGCTLPSVVQNGIVRTAANIDEGWIGVDGRELIATATGQPVTLLNDADAAGIAEMRFGVGVGRQGVVIMITLGTGIGSAVFNDQRLVPNTELGHLEIRGKDAEHRAAASVRERRELSWEKWSTYVDEYIDRLEALLWPDLVIVGGGVSSKFDRFGPMLTTRVPVVPATLGNEAGIVGAAQAGAGAAPGSPQQEAEMAGRPTGTRAGARVATGVVAGVSASARTGVAGRAARVITCTPSWPHQQR